MGDGMQWEAERPLRCPAIHLNSRSTAQRRAIWFCGRALSVMPAGLEVHLEVTPFHNPNFCSPTVLELEPFWYCTPQPQRPPHDRSVLFAIRGNDPLVGDNEIVLEFATALMSHDAKHQDNVAPFAKEHSVALPSRSKKR
jgi:hypothetical protein